MTHYKVNPALCSDTTAFCGVDTSTPGEQFHLLGPVPGANPWYQRPTVDCPTCQMRYDAVINDFLGRREP